MASQQTSPFLCCHNISSTTQNIKIPIFINLQQTNTLTHVHINYPTFCHFLLSTTKVVSSSIRASLKKNIHPLSSYTTIWASNTLYQFNKIISNPHLETWKMRHCETISMQGPLGPIILVSKSQVFFLQSQWGLCSVHGT